MAHRLIRWSVVAVLVIAGCSAQSPSPDESAVKEQARATATAIQEAVVAATAAVRATRVPVLFGDDFNVNELDRAKWDAYKGVPIVSSGWLTLSGAEIQSKPEFSGGILQGIIQSPDWKPQGEFTDSSFGYEIWAGADGKCHYGVVFKASGQLGLLRSQPDMENKCAGQSAGIPGRDPDDPLYQDFLAIPNWNAIKATGTVAFTLTWSTGVTLEVSGGLSNGRVYTDASPAIPAVPLKIRLYAHTYASLAVTDTYRLDYVRLYPDHIGILPIISASAMAFMPTTPIPVSQTTTPVLTPAIERLAHLSGLGDAGGQRRRCAGAERL
jgi:hypothetical protein